MCARVHVRVLCVCVCVCVAGMPTKSYNVCLPLSHLCLALSCDFNPMYFLSCQESQVFGPRRDCRRRRRSGEQKEGEQEEEEGQGAEELVVKVRLVQNIIIEKFQSPTIYSPTNSTKFK